MKLSFFASSVLYLFWLSSVPTLVIGQEKPPLRVVHLGDSYSAGNGARDDEGNENWVGPSGCYRSPTNWGSVFANSLSDVFNVIYINRACSGAVLENLENEQDKLFFSDLPPQIDGVDTSTNIVLMTFGGNDLGFGTIVKECFVLGLRDVADCQAAINAANTGLDNVGMPLKDALVAVGNRLNENAKIVLVSYPHLILDAEFTLEDTFGDAEIRLDTNIRQLANDADDVQRAAVSMANDQLGRTAVIFYDGTKELFAGREPDPSVQTENPDRWIAEFDGVDPAEYYHFNAEGHTQLGQALSAFIQLQDVQPGSFEVDGSIDLAFVVDTTGSMGGEIAAVRANLNTIVSNLASVTSSFRVAVVSYQDFPSRCGGAYASRVDADFTDDVGVLQAAINSLFASGGCDGPESVFSGIKEALDLTWRNGASKSMVVIGDAPPLQDGSGAEPVSGITAEELIAKSIALDPVAVTGANAGSLGSAGSVIGQIAAATGGSIIADGNVVATVEEVIEETAANPFAWIGVEYVGTIGESITFDASGSYDTAGVGLKLYEWDFEADGIYDETTTDPTVTTIYDMAFDGIVVCRVTSEGDLTSLASATVTINEGGSLPMTSGTSCELDDDGNSIYTDEDGTILGCAADSLPTEDTPGLEESTCSGGLIFCFIKAILQPLFAIFG